MFYPRTQATDFAGRATQLAHLRGIRTSSSRARDRAGIVVLRIRSAAVEQLAEVRRADSALVRTADTERVRRHPAHFHLVRAVVLLFAFRATDDVLEQAARITIAEAHVEGLSERGILDQREEELREDVFEAVGTSRLVLHVEAGDRAACRTWIQVVAEAAIFDAEHCRCSTRRQFCERTGHVSLDDLLLELIGQRVADFEQD